MGGAYNGVQHGFDSKQAVVTFSIVNAILSGSLRICKTAETKLRSLI
jgi:hypothetical protein